MFIKECPRCTACTSVADSRVREDGVIRRRRVCRGCGHEFYTIEIPDNTDVTEMYNRMMAMNEQIIGELQKINESLQNV